MGAVIIQKFKPIDFCGRKLTDSQKRYTVTENDLLRIIETLKQFRTILLGQRLRIYTDNKNLTCNFLNTDRVLIWRLILKEYGSNIEYIQGDKNIVAYKLARLPKNRNQETTHKPTLKK